MNEIEKYTDFLFYNSEDGNIKVQVIADPETETIWTTQKGMSEIFGVEEHTITYHLGNVFDSGELNRGATTRKIRVVRQEGGREVKRPIDFYNLDVIIAVGYRVNSLKATKFRIWATGILREYLIKGFALDDERLKQGGRLFDKNYFDELLERIREIRASERMFYQKLTDIFAQSFDYDKTSPITKEFYASVQNKLEYAVIGKTAAEIVTERADHRKEYMGLLTWKDEKRGGKIQLSDAKVAKNYMTHEELSELNQLVGICLDSAEISVKKKRAITMQGWIEQVNAILSIHGYELLKDAGKISADDAKVHAKIEYEKFRPIQDANFISDFDSAVGKIKGEK